MTFWSGANLATADLGEVANAMRFTRYKLMGRRSCSAASPSADHPAQAAPAAPVAEDRPGAVIAQRRPAGAGFPEARLAEIHAVGSGQTPARRAGQQ